MFTMEQQCAVEFAEVTLISIKEFLTLYGRGDVVEVVPIQGQHLPHRDVSWTMGSSSGHGEGKHDTWKTENTVGEIFGSVPKSSIVDNGIDFPDYFSKSGVSSVRFSLDGSRTSSWAKNTYDELHKFMTKGLAGGILSANLGYVSTDVINIGDSPIFTYYRRALERIWENDVCIITGKVLSRVVNIYDGKKFREIGMKGFLDKTCDLQIVFNRNKNATRFWASFNILIPNDSLTDALLARVYINEDDATIDKIKMERYAKK